VNILAWLSVSAASSALGSRQRKIAGRLCRTTQRCADWQLDVSGEQAILSSCLADQRFPSFSFSVADMAAHVSRPLPVEFGSQPPRAKKMPSLPSVQIIEDRTGLPVLSSSVSTTYMMLKKLGLKTYAPGFGSLLSGKY
jgi:hypothetical protein